MTTLIVKSKTSSVKAMETMAEADEQMAAIPETQPNDNRMLID